MEDEGAEEKAGGKGERKREYIHNELGKLRFFYCYFPILVLNLRPWIILHRMSLLKIALKFPWKFMECSAIVTKLQFEN